MNTRENILMFKFYDYKRFPYGFSRSGDFNLIESQLLESKGALIKALMDNEVSNPTDEDLQLKDMISSGNTGNQEAKVWLKYMGIKHTKISVSSSLCDKAVIQETDDWVDDEPFEES